MPVAEELHCKFQPEEQWDEPDEFYRGQLMCKQADAIIPSSVCSVK